MGLISADLTNLFMKAGNPLPSTMTPIGALLARGQGLLRLFQSTEGGGEWPWVPNEFHSTTVIDDRCEHVYPEVNTSRSTGGREGFDVDVAIGDHGFPALGSPADDKLYGSSTSEVAVDLYRHCPNALKVEAAVGALAGPVEFPRPTGIGPLCRVPSGRTFEPGVPRALPRADPSKEMAECLVEPIQGALSDAAAEAGEFGTPIFGTCELVVLLVASDRPLLPFPSPAALIKGRVVELPLYLQQLV